MLSENEMQGAIKKDSRRENLYGSNLLQFYPSLHLVTAFNACLSFSFVLPKEKDQKKRREGGGPPSPPERGDVGVSAKNKKSAGRFAMPLSMRRGEQPPVRGGYSTLTFVAILYRYDAS